MTLLSHTPDGKVTELLTFPYNTAAEVSAAVRMFERRDCADLLPMLGVQS